MKTLLYELERNSEIFINELEQQYVNSFNELKKYDKLYIESYKRMSSLEGWKAFILEKELSKESLSFYIEAQNDVLLSYSLARIGSWRSALHCLRSFIDNLLFCIYYKDHDVEYQLWEEGKHSLPISDYMNYISKHPKINKLDENISGILLLRKEYATLSKAVHASSIIFRMTIIDENYPVIMEPNEIKLKKWINREKRTIKLANLILLSLYSNELEGAKLRDLRKAISLTIPDGMKEDIRLHLKVRLFDSN
jgi:hypothetical protein